MKKRNNILLLLCAVIMASVNSGCRREINYRADDGLVKIDLNWLEGAVIPQSMSYAFYDQSGQLVCDVPMASNVTLEQRLPTGTYDVIIHNTDAANVSYRGMDTYSSAEVFAMPFSRAQSILTEPSNVYGIGKCNEFQQIIVSGQDTVLATATPISLTKRVRIFFDITNINDILAVSGSLLGIVESVNLSTGQPNLVQSCSVDLTCEALDESNTRFSTQVEVFGLHTIIDSPEGTNSVVINIIRENATHQVTVDLTDVVKDLISENGGDIPIEIPVEIKIELTPIGEFKAIVNKWIDGGSGEGEFS